MSVVAAFSRRHKLTLSLMAITILLLKLAIITVPSPELPPSSCLVPRDGCGFIFDEAHYVPAIRKMLQGQAVNNEHPPLSKALMILGVSIFGDNPVGWRIFPAVAGSLNVMLVGLIAYELTRRRSVAYAASFLYGTDVTTFNIGSMAILDAPSYSFLLLSGYLLLRGRLIPSSACLGLAALAKSSSTFTGAGLAVIAFIDRVSRGRGALRLRVSRGLDNVAIIVVMTSIVFVAGIALYDLTYHAYPNPFEHIDFMLSYHSSLRFECSSWFFAFSCIHMDDKPVKVDLPLSWSSPGIYTDRIAYYVVTVSYDGKSYQPVAYYGIAGPLWWTTWVVYAHSAYRTFSDLRARNEKKYATEVFVFFWITTSYLIYFPIAYVLNRWVYSFYFVQALPGVAIGASALLSDSGINRLIMYFLIGMQAVWFAIWFPVKPEWYAELLRNLGLPT